ncbi:hypothetical protein FPV67DRAFT_1098589 [Lyophyllum atratum]|nr:hypothetical protein FPV67DRAFT_1098589 [Lyophyllum atratum]
MEQKEYGFSVIIAQATPGSIHVFPLAICPTLEYYHVLLSVLLPVPVNFFDGLLLVPKA